MYAQSRLTVCNTMDYSPPRSPVHGILQVRILEQVAISFSGDRPDPGIKPRSPAWQADALTSEPPGKLDMGKVPGTSSWGHPGSVALKTSFVPIKGLICALWWAWLVDK